MPKGVPGITGQIPELIEELSRSEEETHERTDKIGMQAANEVLRTVVAEEPPVSRREYELLKREKELLERELRLERREREMSSTSSTATVTSVALRTNVKVVAEMLNEFSSEEDKDFSNWKTQAKLLKESYDLDENSMKLIISQRLHGKAIGWFRAKSSDITLSVAQIFEELQDTFDNCPNKLNRRRRFEVRAWKRGESFNEYFHDKMILAENVRLDQEE